MSLETEAILTRLKKEGDLIRNGKNSIKQVNINLDKLHTTFKAINAAMLNNTAAIKQVSAAEMKIQQEEAERARRQGEIDELTQKDRAKAAELRAKADALRAKEELRDAKGPGFFAKFTQDNTKSTLKMLGIVGGLGLVGSQIVVGVLDQVYGKGQGGWREKLSTSFDELTTAGKTLTNLDTTINNALDGIDDTIAKGIEDGITNSMDKYLKQFSLDNILGGLAKVLPWATILGLAFSYRNVVADIVTKAGGTVSEGLKSKRKLKEIKEQGKQDRRTARAREEEARKTAKQTSGSANQAANQRARRARAAVLRSQLAETAAELGLKQGPGGVTQGSTSIRDDLAARAGSGLKKAARAAPYVGTAVTAADIVMGLGTETKDLSDATLKELMAKDRTGLGDIVGEALLTGAITGTIGGATTAGVGAAPAALAGLGFGFLSGVARAAAEEINDAINDVDNLPNQVEDLLEQDASLRQKKSITPEEIANNVRATINNIDQIRQNLLTDVQGMDAEIASLETQLQETEFGDTRKGRRDKGRLETRLKNLKNDRLLRGNQLQNTIRALEIYNRQNQSIFGTEIGKVTDVLAEKVASVGGGSFVNTQVINNTYNNQFVQNSRNNWNSGQVVVENMTGGSGEQVALG